MVIVGPAWSAHIAGRLTAGYNQVKPSAVVPAKTGIRSSFVDDITAISQLKYRYLRTLDTKQWDEFADCFLPDATGDYNGLVLSLIHI